VWCSGLLIFYGVLRMKHGNSTDPKFMLLGLSPHSVNFLIQYFVRSTNCEAPDCVLFSSLLSPKCQAPSVCVLPLIREIQVPHPYKAAGTRYIASNCRLIVNSEGYSGKWSWPVLSQRPPKLGKKTRNVSQQAGVELESLRARSPTLQRLYSHLLKFG
jgi:hypothetical protein